MKAARRNNNTWSSSLIWGLTVLCLISAFMTFTAAPVGAKSTELSDVPPTHPAYEAVRLLVDKGYLEIGRDGTYRGGEPVDRYTLAIALAKMLNDISATGLGQEEAKTLSRLLDEYHAELVRYYYEQQKTASGLNEEIRRTAALTESISQFLQKVDNLTAQVENQSRNLDSVRRSLEDQGTYSGQKLDSLTQQITAVQTSLNSDIVQLKNISTKLNEELTSLRNAMTRGDDAVRMEVQVQLSIIKQMLDEMIGEQSARIDNLHFRLAETEVGVERNTRNLSQLDKRLAELEKRVTDSAGAINNLRISLEEDLALQTNRLAEQAATINRLTQDIAGLKNDIEQRTISLTEHINKSLADLEKRILSAMTAKDADLDAAIQTERRRINDLSAALTTQSGEISNLKASVAKEERLSAEQATSLAALSQAVEQLKNELKGDMEKMKGSLQNDIAQVNQAATNLAAKDVTLANELAQTRAAVAYNGEQISLHAGRLDQLQAKADQHDKDIAAHTVDIAQLKQKTDQHEKDIAAFKSATMEGLEKVSFDLAGLLSATQQNIEQQLKEHTNQLALHDATLNDHEKSLRSQAALLTEQGGRLDRQDVLIGDQGQLINLQGLRITALEEQSAQQQDFAAVLAGRIDDNVRRLKEAETQLQAHQVLVGEHSTKLAGHDAALQDHEERLLTQLQKIAALESYDRSLPTLFDQQAAQNAAFEVRLSGHEEKLAVQQKQLDKHEAEIAALQIEQQKQQSDIRKVQDQHQILINALGQELTGQIGETVTQLNELRSELLTEIDKSSQETKAAVAEEQRARQTDVATLQGNITGAKSELQQLLKQIDNRLAETAAALQATDEELQQKIVALSAVDQGLRQEITSLYAADTQLNQSIGRLDQSVRQLQEADAKLETALAGERTERQAAVDNLQSRIAVVDKKVDDVIADKMSLLESAMANIDDELKSRLQSEAAYLNQRLNAAEIQIADLVEKDEKLAGDLERTRAEILERQEAADAALQSRITAVDQKVDKVVADKVALLEAAMIGMDSDLKGRLQSEAATLGERLNAAEIQIGELKNRDEELAAALAAAQADILDKQQTADADLERRVTDLDAKWEAALKSEKAERSAAVDSLQSRITAVEQKVDQLDQATGAKIATLEAAMAEMGVEQSTALKNEVAALDRRLAAAEAGLAELQKADDALATAITAQEETLARQQATDDQLRQATEELASQTRKLEEDVAALQAADERLASSIDQLKEKDQNLEASWQKAYADMQAMMEALARDWQARLEAQEQRHQDELAGLRAQVGELQTGLTATQEKLAATQQELARTQDELEATRGDLAAANAAIESIRKEIRELLAQIMAMESQVTLSDEQMAELENSLRNKIEEEGKKSLLREAELRLVLEDMQKDLAAYKEKTDDRLASNSRTTWATSIISTLLGVLVQPK